MSMDSRNTRSRKAIETLSQAINEPTLKDLHAMLYMLRLGHSKLNIDGCYNQICQCGTIKTEVHMFLECPSTCASRWMLFTNVCKILAKENKFSYSEFAALNPAELVEIVLFGHPKPVVLKLWYAYH